MALKKSELYSSIWKSCDELRGGMDASQYKDYVLIFGHADFMAWSARATKLFEACRTKRKAGLRV